MKQYGDMGTASIESKLQRKEPLKEDEVLSIASTLTRRDGTNKFYLGMLYEKAESKYKWCEEAGFRSETVRKYGRYAREVGWNYYKVISYNCWKKGKEVARLEVSDLKKRADAIMDSLKGSADYERQVIEIDQLEGKKRSSALSSLTNRLNIKASQALMKEVKVRIAELRAEREAEEAEAAKRELAEETAKAPFKAPEEPEEETTEDKGADVHDLEKYREERESQADDDEYSPDPETIYELTGLHIGNLSELPDMAPWLIDYFEERDNGFNHEFFEWLRKQYSAEFEEDEQANIA